MCTNMLMFILDNDNEKYLYLSYSLMKIIIILFIVSINSVGLDI